MDDRPVLSLADLERYDPYARAAKRERRFLCPLCGDQKPRDDAHRSLSLNVEQGVWHCWRCRRAGKLREHWGRDDASDVRFVGRPRLLQTWSSKPREDPPLDQGWRKHLAGLRPVTGSAGEEYLRGRGIPADLADTMRVRFHPTWAGRPAILFPQRDDEGNLVAVSGRYTDGGESEHRTRGSAKQGVFSHPDAFGAGPVVIVESPICVLSLALIGVPAVALVGKTAPDWLPRRCFGKRVLVMLDADEPGDCAARLIIPRLESLGAVCHRVRPAGENAGKDPNDVLKHFGVDALRAEWTTVIESVGA